MDILRLVLSGLATNCYIFPTGERDPEDKMCAAVCDPADNAAAIISAAGNAGLTVKYILLTHGHYDHTGAAAELKEKTGAPIYIHKADEVMLSDSVKSLAFFTPERRFVPCEADEFVEEGKDIRLGKLDISVLHTPGHTAGSVCYLFSDPDAPEKRYMLSGDTLFKDSIGRSDTYSGDPVVQLRSLDKIRELEGDYIVLPGHGEATTLETEKRFNPFIADFV